MNYKEYLTILYKRASATKRKQLRKDPQPCSICGEIHTEVSIEGVWLCKEHMVELKRLQPHRTIEQKLNILNIQYASEAEFLAGNYKLKQVNINYKVPFKVSFRTEEYDYNGTGKGKSK
jgi:hypothetical protein